MNDCEKGKILVLDDEEIVHLSIKRLLEKEGHEIESVYKPSEALEKVKNGYDVLISDIRMPGVDGIEVLKSIKKQGIDVEVFLLTGYANLETATNSISYGARDYLLKPIDDINSFIHKVNEAINYSILKKELKSTPNMLNIISSKELEEITGFNNVEMFIQLFNSTQDLIVLLDTNEKIVFANTDFFVTTSRSHKKVIGSPFTSLIPKSGRDEFRHLVKTLKGSSHSQEKEILINTINGDITLNANIKPLFKDSKNSGTLITLTNNTHLKEIRKKVDLLSKITEESKYNIIMTTTPDFAISMCNIEASEKTGYSNNELLRKNISDLIESDINDLKKVIMDELKEKGTWIGEFSLIKKEGVKKACEVTVKNVISGSNSSNLIFYIKEKIEINNVNIRPTDVSTNLSCYNEQEYHQDSKLKAIKGKLDLIQKRLGTTDF